MDENRPTIDDVFDELSEEDDIEDFIYKLEMRIRKEYGGDDYEYRWKG